MIWVETPTNPLLSIADIAAIAEIGHGAGLKVLVDNTFASPALQQPARLGADLIIHSGTKYLDGQGRVVAGAICGPAVGGGGGPAARSGLPVRYTWVTTCGHRNPTVLDTATRCHDSRGARTWTIR
jgi:hypothetical protein